MRKKDLSIAIVGATGAVGREMLRLLAKTKLPLRNVRLFASARSQGKLLSFRDKSITVEKLTKDAFQNVDFALFSAGSSRSKEFAPLAVKSGCIFIDNSSAWRMDPNVPLVVPEVNAQALANHNGIIANPNCSTIQMVLPLKALANHVVLQRVIVSTYQSASGAGQSGINELIQGSRDALDGKNVLNHTFPVPLAFDAIPHIGNFLADGYTTEEQKMLAETRKILSLPHLPVSATCVRIPILRSHLEAVTVDINQEVNIKSVRAWFDAFDGIVLKDKLQSAGYPTARDATNRSDTFIGRIRKDNSLPKTLHFWVVSDNLLKGAAYNAVQILEALNEQ